ncbi:hypothetical protein HS7_17760 [Sulfolobales archaeon HS-7]|nr:hypothetical protein HS7_17760 [Sulfolobales archaeon HS-7]
MSEIPTDAVIFSQKPTEDLHYNKIIKIDNNGSCVYSR